MNANRNKKVINDISSDTETGGIDTSRFNSLKPREKDKLFLGFFQDVQEKIKTLGDDLSKIEGDLAKERQKNIEILGVFVALFTFISVDVQIFKSEISVLSAAGFSLIMFASLMSFVLILSYLLSDKRIDIKIFITILCMLLLGTLGVYWIGKSSNDFYTKEGMDNKIASSTSYSKKELEDFKSCLKSGGWNSCFQ